MSATTESHPQQGAFVDNMLGADMNQYMIPRPRVGGMQWVRTRGRQGFYMSISRRVGQQAARQLLGEQANRRQRPALSAAIFEAPPVDNKPPENSTDSHSVDGNGKQEQNANSNFGQNENDENKRNNTQTTQSTNKSVDDDCGDLAQCVPDSQGGSQNGNTEHWGSQQLAVRGTFHVDADRKVNTPQGNQTPLGNPDAQINDPNAPCGQQYSASMRPADPVRDYDLDDDLDEELEADCDDDKNDETNNSDNSSRGSSIPSPNQHQPIPLDIQHELHTQRPRQQNLYAALVDDRDAYVHREGQMRAINGRAQPPIVPPRNGASARNRPHPVSMARV